MNNRKYLAPMLLMGGCALVVGATPFAGRAFLTNFEPLDKATVLVVLVLFSAVYHIIGLVGIVDNAERREYLVRSARNYLVIMCLCDLSMAGMIYFTFVIPELTWLWYPLTIIFCYFGMAFGGFYLREVIKEMNFNDQFA